MSLTDTLNFAAEILSSCPCGSDSDNSTTAKTLSVPPGNDVMLAQFDPSLILNKNELHLLRNRTN